MSMFDECDQPRRKDMKKSRRSSFFQRRLSSYASDFSSPSNSPVTSNEEADSLKRIQTFKECLDKENQDWKNLLTKLQKEHNKLAENYSQTLDHDCSCWKQLTSADKAFLQDRPDLLKIGRELDSTIEAVTIKEQRLNATNKRVVNLLRDVEETSKEVTGKIIDDFMSNFSELDLQCEK